MKECKCPNCGASISVDETKDINTCQYCNTPFITEKALNNITTNNQANIINNYYGNSVNSTNNDQNLKIPRTPRPKLNIFLALILCCLYIFPGVIYIISVLIAQKKWDDKYTY